MTVVCPHCVVRGRPGASWRATGLFNANRRGLRRAELRCLDPACGRAFSSGQAAALLAGEAAAMDPELQPTVLPLGTYVPQPTLPLERSRRPDFVHAGDLARAVRMRDFKRRASGE